MRGNGVSGDAQLRSGLLPPVARTSLSHQRTRSDRAQRLSDWLVGTCERSACATGTHVVAKRRGDGTRPAC